jgi:hypothetical protein
MMTTLPTTVDDLWSLAKGAETEYKKHHATPPWSKKIPINPCIRLGKQLDSVPCETCTGKVTLKVFECNHGHGLCAPTYIEGVRNCSQCRDRITNWPIQYDARNLWPEQPGWRFNTSIIEYKEGYVLVTRNGWAGSEILIGLLDSNFHPIGDSKVLNLNHVAAAYGREDPRLFWHNGKLHLTYIGVMDNGSYTNVLYARLSDTFDVEEIVHPHYSGRNL